MADIWMDVDAGLSEVPVNIFPLIDDTDFKTRETGIVYNQAGMDLVWNFVTTAGAFTQTAVTPTTGGDYDWTNQGDGMYSIEIPASGGASIDNDTEGFGWFTGICTGVLAWRGPIIGFRDSDLNDKLIDNAWSATRGLAGTAVPDAVADAAGGLPISDAGGLDLDAKLANTNEVTAARMSELDAGTGGKMANQVDLIKTEVDKLRETLYPDNAVYVSTYIGVAGTTPYTHGTVGNPSNNLVNAKDIAEALTPDIMKFRVVSPQTSLNATESLVGYSIIGDNHQVCDLNSVDVGDAYFENLRLEGSPTISGGSTGRFQALIAG